MTTDRTTADYCPTCGHPRESQGAAERFGLSLYGTVLMFGDRDTRLSPSLARFTRVVLERVRASHELIILRVCPDVDDPSNLERVYAKRLRDRLQDLTGGAVGLRTLHSWGYELVRCGEEKAAA
jgi:hypothetical protein